MKISAYSTFKIKDIKYLKPYSNIYLCMKKVTIQDIVKGTEISKNLLDILENIKKNETQNLYLKEIEKIQEFLFHNQMAEVPYHSYDMLKVKLSTGRMCKTTIQMLIEYCGLGADELTEFSELFHFKIQEDVDFLYEEIERNLDGRYGVNYNELY